MKILAVPPDAEHVIVDFLTAALLSRPGNDVYVDMYMDTYPGGVTVGTSIPSTWEPRSSASHVQVGHDGTPEVTYPHIWRASVRVTCWASSTTAAKALAGLCEALLLSHGGGAGVVNIKSLTGVLPTRDPDTGAQLASISVRVSLRGIVLV